MKKKPSKLKHVTEFIFLKALFGLFKLMPYALVTAFANAIGTFIASLPLRTNSGARANIRTAFPSMDEKDVRRIQEASTRNMVATFFEMPKVYSLNKKAFDKRVEVIGLENLKQNPDALMLTAHFGNWELPLRMAALNDIVMGNVYRRANNPLVDKIITDLRQQPQGRQFPKGKDGSRGLIRAIKEGICVGFLNDQKLRDGVKTKFFGQNVMTAASLADLALKFNRPVCPMFCVRKGSHFTITIGEPLKLPKDSTKATQLFNDVLEKEITKNPEQWMWAHKRFA